MTDVALPTTAAANAPEPKNDPVALAALIVGILTIVPGCCLLYCNTPFAIVSVVLGMLAIFRIRQDPTALKGREFAIGGIALSIIGVLTWVVLVMAGMTLESIQERTGVSRGSSRSVPDVEEREAEPAIDVSARDLAREYRSNEVAAEARYLGRRVRVTGIVERVQRDVLGRSQVLLETDNQFLSVIANTSDRVAAQIQPGARIELVCVGGQMVLQMPTLEECAFEQ